MNRLRWLLVGTMSASLGLHDAATVRGSEPFHQPDAPATVLSEGITIERAGVPGDRHRYEVWLAAGDFFEISVSQDQLRVTIALHGPDDELRRMISFPEGLALPERLLFVPSEPGPVQGQRSDQQGRATRLRPGRGTPEQLFDRSIAELRPSRLGRAARHFG